MEAYSVLEGYGGSGPLLLGRGMHNRCGYRGRSDLGSPNTRVWCVAELEEWSWVMDLGFGLMMDPWVNVILVI